MKQGMATEPNPNKQLLAQPKNHYDYDGIFGQWVWFPWQFHLGLAVLAWPFFLWLFPTFPFGKAHLNAFYKEYAVWIALTLSLMCALTALLSYTMEKEGLRSRGKKRISAKEILKKASPKKRSSRAKK